MAKSRVRRQPQRTCVGCRRVVNKRDLTRIVRTPAGQVVIDATGKLSGRGVYLCGSRRCWTAALAQKRIGTALKVALTPEDCSMIEAYAASLPEGEDQPEDLSIEQ